MRGGRGGDKEDKEWDEKSGTRGETRGGGGRRRRERIKMDTRSIKKLKKVYRCNAVLREMLNTIHSSLYPSQRLNRFGNTSFVPTAEEVMEVSESLWACGHSRRGLGRPVVW